MSDRDINIPITATDGATPVFERAAKSASLLSKAIGSIAGQGAADQLLGFGKLFAGTSVVTGGLNLFSGLIRASRGDAKGLLEELEKMPFGLGRAVAAGHQLYDVINQTEKKASELATVTKTIAAGRGMFAGIVQGAAGLQDSVTGLQQQAGLAGLSQRDRGLAEIGIARDKLRKDLQDQAEAAATEIRKKRNAIFGDFIVSDEKGNRITDETQANQLRERLANERAEVEKRIAFNEAERAAGRTGRTDAGFSTEESRQRIREIDHVLKPLDSVIRSAIAATAGDEAELNRIKGLGFAAIDRKAALDARRLLDGAPLGGAGSAIEGRLLTGGFSGFDVATRNAPPSATELQQTDLLTQVRDILTRIANQRPQIASIP